MPRKIKGYGWNPDLPDGRDLLYGAPVKPLAKLPERVDLRSKCPPIYDQGELGSCFPAGTLIRMADGSEREIEEVRLGEYVATAEGNQGMVRQTMIRMETEGLVNLSLWGYGKLRLTAEHPVLTKRGYVKAGDLRLDDWVGETKFTPDQATKEIPVGELLAKHERAIKAGVRKMGTLPGRADVAVRVASLPDVVELTPRIGRLVGLFLAEGSTSSGKALFTFGANEEDTLVAETVDLLTDLGIDAHVQPRPNNSINVVVYGTAWARFWERLCGTGAGEKTLHPKLCGGPDEFRRGVLEGWLAGDGYASKKIGRHRRIAGSTVSKRLAFAIFDIAQSLGLRPVLRKERAKRNSAAGHRRDFFSVETPERAGEKDWRCREDERHVWRRVRALEHEEFAGHVYNLSIEGDESYVADGIAVHNCTGNAIAAAFEFDQMKQRRKAFTPSRLFIYYNERAMEGTVDSDSGAQIRDGVKSVAKQGVCNEANWPYVIPDFRDKPARACYTEGKLNQAIQYLRVPQVLGQMKGCLAEGFPFVFGFTVYESFESAAVAKTGHAPMPRANEAVLGGHAVMAVGYDEGKQWFIVRNSWGKGWGMQGYFTLPYPYLAQASLASDFWTIRSVEASAAARRRKAKARK